MADADDGSNRSRNGEGTSLHGRRRAEGNVLAVLLGAVVIFALIGGSLFEIGNAARQRSLQTQYRDRAVASTEFSVEPIRRAAIQQLQQQAWLDVASLDLNQTQAQGSKETGYYNLDLQPNQQETVTPELAVIMAIPTTDPRGGFGPLNPTDSGIAEPDVVTTIPPGGLAPTAPVDVEIHAVIVSAAQSPWDAFRRIAAEAVS